jgi:hypothetical protein
VKPGLPNLTIYGLAIDADNNVFVGALGGGVWRRPLSELTDIKIEGKDIPTDFVLKQNYPNPFNPSTIISYSLPTRQFVTLKVYDVLGKEISTLVNEEKPAGGYTVQFNATNLPSGVYFYRINSGNYSETKKLLLLK